MIASAGSRVEAKLFSLMNSFRPPKKRSTKFIQDDAQHQRLLWRVGIQPGDGAPEMRVDLAGRPQALHAGRKDPGGAGHRAATPSPQMGRRHRLLHPCLQPSNRCSAKRPTQRFTARREIPSCSAMRCWVRPCALNTMISARRRSRTDTVVARAAAQFLSLLRRQLDPLTRHNNSPIWHADNIIRTTCL
jgi:hypothetical protein